MKQVAALFLVVLALCAQSPSADAKAKPSFQADLKKFGYIENERISEYSSLGFLSENLLLVAINQETFNGAPPASGLVVFDVDKKQALRTRVISLMKSRRSVAPLTDGNFLVLFLSDMKLCSADLQCEESFPTKGTVDVLDSDSLKTIPGAQRFVLRSDNASADGSRTVISELRSTAWNKITHPLALDEPSPRDLRLIAVHDNSSGKALLSLQYNPKNQVVGPALSPHGTRLAIVRDGALEVYDVP